MAPYMDIPDIDIFDLIDSGKSTGIIQRLNWAAMTLTNSNPITYIIHSATGNLHNDKKWRVKINS